MMKFLISITIFYSSITKSSDLAELTPYLQDNITPWTVTLPSPQRGAGLESLNLLCETLSIHTGTIYSRI